MDDSMTPELKAKIDAKIASGMYGTVNDVVREALHALNEREERARKLEDLRQELQLGIDDIEAGRVTSMTAEELQDMKRRGRERRAAASVGEAKHA